MPTRIAIVDDKQINRTTVKEKITSFKEIELVLEAKNGHDFLEQLKQLPGQRLPQVVLMDLEMPIMDGIQTITRATVAYPDVKFIVLTVFEDDEKIFEAIKAGAGGYLLKDDSAVNIIDAITNVVEYNGIPMSPAIARKAMELLKHSPVPVSNEAATVDSALSDREMEILKLIGQALTNKEISELIFISDQTASVHRKNIMRKLGVNSTGALIKMAFENHLV